VPHIQNNTVIKLTQLAEHLENIFQPNTAENNEVLSDVVLQDSVEIPLTSPAEVKREIRTNINPKKGSWLRSYYWANFNRTT
jgi:hypothetical protein